ncbi:hypothetical protein BT67DRAFT_42071 [Trichocladium antarcticum]|uniref:Uncharacterized protein n=1 Tax=Trichocladium antarcticum TaxID=1450529 RepID=A0AAN6UIP5_9PEZI|nr:hypothetical protein BT67DRAFT_42071 [Trichocladium antarcticum]
MATSDNPMTASQGLLSETTRLEGGYGAVKKRLDELQARFKLRELKELAALKDELKAIDAEFEKQRDDISANGAQMDSSLRETFEKLLREKRDSRAQAAKSAYRAKKRERKKCYDNDKKKYKQEAFTAITALMKAEPLPPISHLAETAASHHAGPAKVEPAVAPQFRGTQSLFTGQVVSKAKEEQLSLSPGRRSGTKQATFSRGVIDLVFPVSPAEPAAEQEASPPEPTVSAGVGTPPSVAAEPVPDSDPNLKRKAKSESKGASKPAQIRIKRAKLDHTNSGSDGHSSEFDHQKAAQRTVIFEEVYAAPPQRDQNGKLILAPGYRHVIVQYPSGTGDFYILKCDEHGVHFGEHPLRGAAKHLASAQHGNMSKAHATAIATLGHLVLGCTPELAEKNNARVVEAFKEGAYKPFNANYLSQTKRAELGFPPLESPMVQKAAAQRGSLERPSATSPARVRKQFAGIVDPVSSRFYLACRGDLKIPVLILPWGDVSPAGLGGTLADTGLLGDFTDDGKPLGVPKLPKCYEYDQVNGRIIGIRGWARGYESGPLMRKREFPVLCVDGPDYRSWGIGWLDAASLSVLDFNDGNSLRIQFVGDAWEYYIRKILPNAAQGGTGTSTPQQQEYDHSTAYTPTTAPESASDDIEMKDAETAYTEANNRRDSPSEPRSRAHTDFKPSASAAPTSPATNARIIAAQALGLPDPAPARNGFTAVNSGPPTEFAVSRSASASLEPPSRAGSVSSTGPDRRPVVTAHGSSNSPRHASQTHTAPSIVLSERPAGATSPRVGTQPAVVRKPSPASLQNILQNFESESSGPLPRSECPKPQAPQAQHPLPLLATHTAPSLPPTPSNPTINIQPPRESRAGSAPVQQKDSLELEEEKPRAGSAAADPGQAKETRLPSPSAAPETQEQQPLPPQTIILPPLPAAPPLKPPHLTLNISPLTSPAASALSTRANTPVLAQSKPGTPTVPAFAKPKTPTPTPTPTPANSGIILPTMDVFDISGFTEGDQDMFTTKEPREFLRLVDDHASGIFRTADDAPAAVVVDARRVRLVERMPAPTGAVCTVKLTYHGDGGAEGRTQLLVFEKARSTASGMLNGVAHARRFCRRLQAWNPDVVVPSPNAG